MVLGNPYYNFERRFIMNIIKLTSQFQTTNENYWEELFMEEEQFNDCILPVLEEHGMSLLLDEVGYDKEDIYAGVTYQFFNQKIFLRMWFLPIMGHII